MRRHDRSFRSMRSAATLMATIVSTVGRACARGGSTLLAMVFVASCTSVPNASPSDGGHPAPAEAMVCANPVVQGDAVIEASPSGGPYGVYHAGRVDAVNVEIRPDGTFRWSIMA